MSMGFSRRELLVTIAALGAAWVVAMLLLTAWQRRTGQRRAGSEPTLIHYPGTEDRPEQTSLNLGFRKYWFLLHEAYPSKSPYQFYDREMRQRGWRRHGAGEPQWYRRAEGGRVYDLLHAVWVSPDGLFQMELEMTSAVTQTGGEEEAVSEEREPGIKVYVTQQRVTIPSLMIPKGPGGRPRGEIEAAPE